VTKEIRGQVKRREERWEEGRRKGRGEEKDTPSAHMGFLYVGGFLWNGVILIRDIFPSTISSSLGYVR
jgi:hypothetical protein